MSRAAGPGSARTAAIGSVATAILSVQLGAGFAVGLFPRVGSVGVVTVRLVGSAVVLLLVLASRRGRDHRGRLRRGRPDRGAAGSTVSGRPDRRALGLAVVFGLVLAVMNTTFYAALDRLPQGAAVTIEFIGPLALSVVLSRRRRDVAWVVLAAAGVVAVGRGGLHGLDPAGVAFGLAAAACWACYILLSRRVGASFAGLDGLVLASVVAAVAALPLGVSSAGSGLLRPHVLLVGLAVGVLSSALPYGLELRALRTLDERTFGVLMSVEPAVGALVGLVVLGQRLALVQVAGIVAVVIASAGSTLGAASPAAGAPAGAVDPGRPPGLGPAGDLGLPAVDGGAAALAGPAPSGPGARPPGP